MTELRQMAEETGHTLSITLNKVLKDAVMGKKAEGSRLDRLEREVERLKKEDFGLKIWNYTIKSR